MTKRENNIRVLLGVCQPDERLRILKFIERFCPICGRVKGLWSHSCVADLTPTEDTDAQ